MRSKFFSPRAEILRQAKALTEELLWTCSRLPCARVSDARKSRRSKSILPRASPRTRAVINQEPACLLDFIWRPIRGSLVRQPAHCDGSTGRHSCLCRRERRHLSLLPAPANTLRRARLPRLGAWPSLLPAAPSNQRERHPGARSVRGGVGLHHRRAARADAPRPASDQGPEERPLRVLDGRGPAREVAAERGGSPPEAPLRPALPAAGRALRLRGWLSARPAPLPLASECRLVDVEASRRARRLLRRAKGPARAAGRPHPTAASAPAAAHPGGREPSPRATLPPGRTAGCRASASSSPRRLRRGSRRGARRTTRSCCCASTCSAAPARTAARPSCGTRRSSPSLPPGCTRRRGCGWREEGARGREGSVAGGMCVGHIVAMGRELRLLGIGRHDACTMFRRGAEW